jgi:DNA processing protein
MNDADERRCLIALHLVPAIGAVRMRRLVSTLGSAAAACGASQATLATVPGIGPRLAARIVSRCRAAEADRELRRAEAVGARVVTWVDPDYPRGLRPLRDAPPVLYLRGGWSEGAEPAVAVVGTRRASAYGLGVARALGELLGSAGVVVVSGLARGIDREAHAGALRAGGMTVGVLGCGVDVVYPGEHRSLMEAMMQRGAVVAEVPLGTRPRPQQFPPRNRLISGLARLVVVVEGAEDSGALITARYARSQGRQVYAVPGSVFAPGSRGPHRLLSEGAQILHTPDSLLAALGLPPARRRAERTEDLGPEEARVFALLAEEAVHIDEVITRAGLSPAQVLSALATLEVRGLIRQFPGKNFARQGVVEGTVRTDAGGDAWPSHSSS